MDLPRGQGRSNLVELGKEVAREPRIGQERIRQAERFEPGVSPLDPFADQEPIFGALRLSLLKPDILWLPAIGIPVLGLVVTPMPKLEYVGVVTERVRRDEDAALKTPLEDPPISRELLEKAECPVAH